MKILVGVIIASLVLVGIFWIIVCILNRPIDNDKSKRNTTVATHTTVKKNVEVERKSTTTIISTKAAKKKWTKYYTKSKDGVKIARIDRLNYLDEHFYYSKGRYFVYKYIFPDGKVYIGRSNIKQNRFGNVEEYIGQDVYFAMIKYPNFKKEKIFISDYVYAVGEMEHLLILEYWGKSYNRSKELEWKQTIDDYVKTCYITKNNYRFYQPVK